MVSQVPETHPVDGVPVPESHPVDGVPSLYRVGLVELLFLRALLQKEFYIVNQSNQLGRRCSGQRVY